jgi:ribosome-associated heat shock protein Hsp15
VRIKPARAVRTGDRLQIKKGEQRFEITVTGISERRGPAEVARTLYVESEESIRARQQAREERRLMASPEPSRRPDKRSRRQIRRLKG